MKICEKMAEAIRDGMKENPIQWGAFLTGLETGYQLYLAANQEKQEKKD